MATDIDWKNTKHDVTPRNERRMFVEVDIEPAGGSTICGQRVPRGKSRILIYKSELASLEARTQSDDERALWATAVRSYEERRNAHLGRISDPEARKHADSEIGFSPSSIYHDLRGAGSRGLPPVRSFRVLADDVPAPETPGNIQANQMSELAKTLAALLGLNQSQGTPAKAR
jgi:hypothetical protein